MSRTDKVLLFFLVFLVVNIMDIAVYKYVVYRYGPQHNFWPLSGFYILLKHL
jgi:hypothetical protein